MQNSIILNIYIPIYTYWSFFILAQSVLRHDGATLPARWSPSKQIGMSSLSRIIGQGLLLEKTPKQRDVDKHWWTHLGRSRKDSNRHQICSQALDFVLVFNVTSVFGRHLVWQQVSFQDWWTAAIWVWLMIIVVSLVVINIATWRKSQDCLHVISTRIVGRMGM